MAEKGEPAIHVRAEEAEEKRREWLDKASELKEEGQHEEAIEYFDRIIRAGLDRNGYVHSGKASVLAELGRYGEAIECLEEALRLDPDAGSYALELGQVLYTASEYDKARSAFERAAADTFIYGLSDEAKDWLARLDQEGH
ncbi:tetratricopeptide repeat protein [Gemmatimonadota bacterium]